MQRGLITQLEHVAAILNCGWFLRKISIVGPALATSQLATTDLQERSHQHGLDFIFPKPPFREKSVIQGSFQHSWFSKWPFLHYNQAEDTVFCHTCMKMKQILSA